MDFENEIKNRLLMRGFPNEKLLNNRGLIGATIDEVILLTVKNLAIHNVVNRRELLTAFYRSLEGGDYLYPEECDMHIDNFESGL